MTRPSFIEAIVPPAKISNYLLCPEHPEGSSKARFFLSRGFTVSGWQDFADALRRQAVDGEITGTVDGRFGVKFVVDGVIHCPDHSFPIIRTVWIVDSDEANPRLVTAHPM